MKKSYLSIIGYLLHSGLCLLMAQSVRVDSLNSALSEANGLDKVQILTELSWEYRNSNLDSSFLLADEAIKLSKLIQSEKGLALGYNSLANIYEAQGNVDSAFMYHQMALNLHRQLQDSIGTADALNNMGILYDEIGHLENALQHYFEALKIYETLKNLPAKEAMVLVNIGIVYKKQHQYAKVLEYYQRAEALYNQTKNDFGLMVVKGNIGSVLINLGDFERSITYSSDAIKMYQKVGYERYVPYSQHNLAIGLDSLGKIREAEKNYREALQKHYSFQNNYEAANVYRGLADNLIRQHKYDEAIQVAQKGMVLADQTDAAEFKLDLLKALAKASAKSQKNADAYTYYERVIALKDSIRNAENTKIIFELQTAYETEKKEQQIRLQQAELRENRLIIQRDRYLLGAFSVSILLLLFIGFLFLNRMKHKQRSLLEQEKNKAKEAQISAVIASQERERNRFARDLHDTFGQLISILNMNLESIKNGKPSPEKRDEVFKTSTAVLSDMYAELKNICFDLMPQSLIKGGLQPALQEFADRINSSDKVVVTTDFYGIDNRFDELVEISLYRISQEWINNILKYSDATLITMQLTGDTNELTLLIEDNGSGFDAQLLTKGKGNGWKNISSRTNLIQGELTLDTIPGRKGNTLIINASLKKEKSQQKTRKQKIPS